MKSPVYDVHVNGIPYRVSQAELEQLQELGMIDSIDATITPQDRVIITAGADPAAAATMDTGQVWYNEAALY